MNKATSSNFPPPPTSSRPVQGARLQSGASRAIREQLASHPTRPGAHIVLTVRWEYADLLAAALQRSQMPFHHHHHHHHHLSQMEQRWCEAA
ncbi:unnamed protein product [Gadus morhua 'NCC']